jgi:methanogenic corrinoid protein MtbC1
MQEKTALELTKKYLDEGVAAFDLFGCYQATLEGVGRRFEKQMYFIPELVMSGQMMKAQPIILSFESDRKVTTCKWKLQKRLS